MKTRSATGSPYTSAYDSGSLKPGICAKRAPAQVFASRLHCLGCQGWEAAVQGRQGSASLPAGQTILHPGARRRERNPPMAGPGASWRCPEGGRRARRGFWHPWRGAREPWRGFRWSFCPVAPERPPATFWHPWRGAREAERGFPMVVVPCGPGRTGGILALLPSALIRQD